eukprot:TRINITY_DN4758_c0_g1_i1.p1 TRINITY_DN4758_c0_g1~~TRINITY_DN4758_c0_g1_i1.p1  ORF type:complete len:544 (+),score=101.16 TRINITY_DN4758_c0_g1_i1:119-1633(+)
MNQRRVAQVRRASLREKITDHYIFGSCEQGQLGLGEMEELVLGAKKIGVLEGLPVKKLVVGHNHSFAILKESKIMSWGYNRCGQLGLGHTQHVATPTELPLIEGHKVIDIFCGPLQTWLITENLKTSKQAIWHSGSGYAEVGEIKFTKTRSSFTKVKKSSFMGNLKVKKIIPAGDFCLWIDENGKLYSFGVNTTETWQLGQGFEKAIEILPQPTPIPTLAGIKFKDAAVGWGHTIAVTEDKRVFSWGSNLHGQCGLGHKTSPVRAPKEIEALRGVDVVQVVCGETHSMVLDASGSVYVWGSSAEGKLGLGDVEQDVEVPIKIKTFENKGIIQISAGTDHSAALSRKGELWVWGFGQHGALSVQSYFKNAKSPLQLNLFPTSGQEEEEEEEHAARKAALERGEDLKKVTLYDNDEPDQLKNPLEVIVSSDEEEMIRRMEKLPEARVAEVDPRGFPEDHKDYPFIIEGQKVSEGEFFSRKYTHLPVAVFCGMDSTTLTVVSSPQRE